MHPRKTIHFSEGVRVFNVRVAGVAVRNGHVLVCREDDDLYAMLPGGRVEHGELSDVALAREIKEELNCEARIGRLLFSVENLFHLEGETFHQIGLYYEIDLPENFPFRTDDTCLMTRDEGHDLKFDWVPATVEGLTQWQLIPVWLRARIRSLPDTTEQLMIDER